jgi:hypothetical protein
MSEPLASFRDLKGIGPAIEAQLHEAGVYTWEALSAAASALAAVRGEGDTLSEVANLVAARRSEAGGQAALRLPGGERLEAFVLRMTLAADGEPRRCTATHVRTMAEQAWAGWTPGEFARFIEERSGLRMGPSPAEATADSPAEEPSRDGERVSPPPQQRRVPASPQRPSRDHLVVLDAGKAIGGASRDIDLVVTNTGAAGADFDYRATLAARRLGARDTGEGWTSLASHAGTGHPARELALRFPAVQLPTGVHRLQLLLEVNLPAPTSQPQALTLA